MSKKNILFLTGTRADFGKIKSLIRICDSDNFFKVHVFVTGMHMQKLYGYTVDEVIKSGFKNIFKYKNHDDADHMDRTLSKTIDGLSSFISDNHIDLIVVHGDRVEALAGSIVGSLNNILVAHVEGGEISGTVDELIRHAVSKMSHIHLVSNEKAKQRLLQLGERKDSIHVIGSPDLDLMFSDKLPEINFVKRHYGIDFDDYAIAMYHPVTTEIEYAEQNAKKFVDALELSGKKFIVIYPNNDLGSEEILHQYRRIIDHPNFKVFPSIRFEYFLVLLKNCEFIIGNSSAAVREAPYYNIPTINLGSRQQNRVIFSSIINCGHDTSKILKNINKLSSFRPKVSDEFKTFGLGNSDKTFKSILHKKKFWETEKQKQFQEI